MNVNGIGAAGYPAWQGARKAQQNAAGKSFAEFFPETERRYIWIL